MNDDSHVPVTLDDRERRFLRAGLLDWSGPADPTDELAEALGFHNADSLARGAWGLWKRIEAGEVLSTSE